MGVFLTILKIIGIILLVVLGLVITLILFIMFIPIRYNVSIVKSKEDSRADITVKITWLLHLINALVKYKDKLFYRIRVTFITIFTSEKSEKQNRKSNVKSKKQRNDRTYKKSSENDTLNSNIDNNRLPEKIEKDVDYTLEGFDVDNQTELNEENYDNIDEEKISFIKKLCIYFGKIKNIILNIPNIISNICNSFENQLDKVTNYIDIFQDDRNKSTINLILCEIKKILNNIKPSTIKGNVTFGFEDPYQMGQSLSILSFIYPFIGDCIEIRPVFDTSVFDCNIYIKGKVTIFLLLRAGYIYYFNKDVIRLRKQLKMEEK